MIVVDAETTGLDPSRHLIVSIGAVEFANPQNQFYGECRIWEGAAIDPQALERNGATLEESTDPGARRALKEAQEDIIEGRLHSYEEVFGEVKASKKASKENFWRSLVSTLK